MFRISNSHVTINLSLFEALKKLEGYIKYVQGRLQTKIT